jgi:glycosyltransferase involved in cell wall biosynthesis
MKLKIAILGTRGIPNQYGGYEQAATFLSEGLVKRGHRVTVYNSHNHPYQEREYKGVEIVHCFDPEYKTGTAGQFIYDLNCLRHAQKRNYDALLLLGYTSSSIWGRFYPKKTIIISNMDGLEWKRCKYSVAVRRYLRYAEKLAVKYSNYFVADSPVIKKYLKDKYDIESCYIPYGANTSSVVNEDVLKDYGVTAGNYHLLIARIEPENNITTILEGFVLSKSQEHFVVVGNTGNKYGRKIKEQFGKDLKIHFVGPIFNQEHLQSLRKYCKLYFHGHSVGGTNPSLLEAMASEAVIAAHNNDFNKAILGDDTFYFSSTAEVKNILQTLPDQTITDQIKKANLEKVKEFYTWEKIINQYEDFILECYNQAKS